MQNNIDIAFDLIIMGQERVELSIPRPPAEYHFENIPDLRNGKIIPS